MVRIAARTAIVLCAAWTAQGQEPEGLLDRFLTRMKAELARLPDYVCTQTVERFSRNGPERPWQAVDTLRFDVALVGDRELYGTPGAKQFHDRPLADVVGRGTVSTGRLGLLAGHVFAAASAHFTFRGETDQDGQRVVAYDYDIPPDRSNYRLRSGTEESVVGFQGTFWFNAETLDLARLEVQAYDMPESLGLAEANTSLTYARVPFEMNEALLPVLATLTIVLVDGHETLNRTGLGGCRQYSAESVISFGNEAEPARADRLTTKHEQPASLPVGTLLEIVLESSLDANASTVGEVVRARVAKAVKDGEREVVPQGAAVLGHIVRLTRETIPFPIYEVGLEFHTLELGDSTIPFTATMADAGPAAGLLRQARRMDPTFTRRRTARMNILVREVQRGQGILHWEAKRGPIPRGLRMKWRVEAP